MLVYDSDITPNHPGYPAYQRLAAQLSSGRVALVPLGQTKPDSVPLVGWYDRRYIFLLPDVASEQAERLMGAVCPL